MGESLICFSFFPLLSKDINHQTGTGRQYPEGFLFAAECKRMGKTSRERISGGEILKKPGPYAGCRANAEEEEDMSKKAFCKFMYYIMVYIFSTVVVNIINAYRIWQCCVMEVEQRNSKTPRKNKMSLLEVNSITHKSLINLSCLE